MLKQGLYTIFIMLFGGLSNLLGQYHSISVEGGYMIMEISSEAGREVRDSLLLSCEIDPVKLYFYYQKDSVSSEGWGVDVITKNTIILSKKIADIKALSQMDFSRIFEDNIDNGDTYHAFDYGFNDFTKSSVVELENGKTLFFLSSKSAKGREDLYLSGSFNGWSTLSHPLLPCDSGFYQMLDLKPGGHFYKFIVGGHWITDPRNRKTFHDFEGNENSLYFKPNCNLHLSGYETSRKVYVAGSFNNWNENEIELRKGRAGWSKSIYLKEGTHAYKFIVNGNWLLDPNNPIIRDDGAGNKNSFISVGDTFYFELNKFAQASEVYVLGDFNAWNERELRMQRNQRGWVLPYVLAPGNYTYKFVVDGQWINDPENYITDGEGEYLNSIKVIKPNKTFVLKGFKDAQDVRISGDFNGWSATGYTMKKTAEGWYIKLHLPIGKNRYKFVVDGEWITDPNNPLWEDNEYGTGNSIVWIN